MARKKVTVTIDADNRDKGRSYIINEMPAEVAERFAYRALLALTSSNTQVPPDISSLDIDMEMDQASMAKLAAFGLKAFLSLDYDRIAPLLDQMMQYIQIDMGGGVVRQVMPDCDDIEETSTLFKIRKAFMELHVGFSMAGLTQTLGSVSAAAKTNGS